MTTSLWTAQGTVACLCAALAGLVAAVAAPAAEHPSLSMPAEGAWRGIVRAVQLPTLSSDLALPIIRIAFREGERFAKGKVLIEFDCRRLRYDAAALAAAVREARVAVATNEYLARRGASNVHDVEVARARHDKAKAEHDSLMQRISTCTIAAPFDGVVTMLAVNVHETPTAGRPLMTIASADSLEIELIAPARALRSLQPGTPLSFSIEGTLGRYDAKVIRSGGAVDPVSQTAKVFAAFTSPPRDVLPGMSGGINLASGMR